MRKVKPMGITAIDPHTALIVIDMQKGLSGLPTVHPFADIARATADLAAAFRRHALPVVLVNVIEAAPGRTEQHFSIEGMPADWAELVPELDAQPDDLRVTKRSWGAFATTDLEARLRERGTTQVVVAGVATSLGVESTARQAYELGFNVTLALDAMTDLSKEAHDNSVTRIFPRLGETGAAKDVVSLLGRA